MTLTIDGRTIAFEGRPTLLEVAGANGIFVPSLCEHPGLEPYAACRLCLVEVQGRKGFAPACSTAAEEGLVVRTSTPELAALRRGVLELILAEHPHACLICAEKASCDDLKSTIRKTGEVTGCVLCPANGRCQLQRVVASIGLDVVPFPSRRREGQVRRDDPFIDRDNSLCILCGRCVRVCREIRGAEVLTFVSRGSDTVVGTALDRRLLDSGCQFCGACVDACPTASLTDRSTRYDPLPETEKKIVCPLCGQGCGLTVGSKDGRMMTTVPDPEGRVNRGQACVRGRFLARPVVHHPRRLLVPQVREKGALRAASWDEALDLAATRLAGYGPGDVTVAASAQSSCEDIFTLHKLTAGVLKGPGVSGPWAGSAAAALAELGRAAGQTALRNFRMSDLSLAESIVVVGEDLTVAQPIVGLHVHRAVVRGAALIQIDAGKGLRGLPGRLDASKSTIFLFGPALLDGKDGLARLAALWNLAAAGGGRLIALDREANTRGGLEIAAGFAAGFSRAAVRPPGPGTAAPRALYIAGPHRQTKPGAAELVIVQASYGGEDLNAADVVLPEATAFETESTLVNIEGRIQVSGPAIAPLGEAKPGWWIAKSLAARLGARDFGCGSAEDIRRELASAVPAFARMPAMADPAEERFLVEGPAGAATRLDEGSFRGREAGRKPAAPRDPDDYKGLNMALEHKSLKLVRGR
jgi:predicted molibdopterin-dependent oxidoreductase YjgC